MPLAQDGDDVTLVDTGYGNALNVWHAVQRFIQAGVAGIHLEDQVFPKRCGHVAGIELIPVEEAVGKYRAAVAERDRLDPDVVVIARTDSRAAVGGSVDEVLRRCEAYLEAGVDMLMVVALQTREEIRRVMEAFPGTPIYINAGAVRPLLTHAEYAGMGVATYNVSVAKVAQIMMERFLEDCRRRGADAFNDFMASETATGRSTLDYLSLTGFPAVVEMADVHEAVESSSL